MAKSVLDLLEEVDEVTTKLSGEKYSTLSWYLPLLFGLLKSTKCHDADSTLLTTIKKKLKAELLVRFDLDDLDMDSLPVLAAALDPRFRKLPFLEDEQRSKVQDILVAKAEKAVITCDS